MTHKCAQVCTGMHDNAQAHTRMHSDAQVYTKMHDCARTYIRMHESVHGLHKCAWTAQACMSVYEHV